MNKTIYNLSDSKQKFVLAINIHYRPRPYIRHTKCCQLSLNTSLFGAHCHIVASIKIRRLLESGHKTAFYTLHISVCSCCTCISGGFRGAKRLQSHWSQELVIDYGAGQEKNGNKSVSEFGIRSEGSSNPRDMTPCDHVDS